MKNKLKLSLLSFALIMSTSSFASQLCSPEIVLHYGSYSAPAGWHVGRMEIDTGNPVVMRDPNFKLTFYTAMYNYSESADKRISCTYLSDEAKNIITIATDQTGFAAPSQTGTKWKPLAKSDGLICGFGEDATVSDCPWG